MIDSAPSVVRRYMEVDDQRDVDSLVDLFTTDATVVDEGVARQGKAEIRLWKTGTESKYTYTKTILGGEAVAADRYVVRGRLDGNFPGGTADLAWDFTIVDDRISHLVIAPPA